MLWRTLALSSIVVAFDLLFFLLLADNTEAMITFNSAVALLFLLSVRTGLCSRRGGSVGGGGGGGVIVSPTASKSYAGLFFCVAFGGGGGFGGGLGLACSDDVIDGGDTEPRTKVSTGISLISDSSIALCHLLRGTRPG